MRELIIAGLFIILSGFVAFSQDNPPQTEGQDMQQMNTAQWSVNHYFKVYQLSRSLEDLESAKDALLDILVEIPKNDTILFELAGLYYQMQNYPSAAITASEVLKSNPGQMGMLEVAAVSFENLDMKKEAINYYEKIYLKTEDFGTLYKVALFQYELGRFREAITNLQILIDRQESEDQSIAALSTEGMQKNYKLKAVLLNLLGMAKRDSGDKEGAKQAFQAALEMAPDFAGAAENLKAINEN